MNYVKGIKFSTLGGFVLMCCMSNGAIAVSALQQCQINCQSAEQDCMKNTNKHVAPNTPDLQSSCQNRYNTCNMACDMNNTPAPVVKN